VKRALVVLLLGLAGVALAQRETAPVAVERFHDAARLFVGGDTAAAAREARAGLAAAPGDPALTALLAEILRRPPPQPSGGGATEPPPEPPPADDEGPEQPNAGPTDEGEPRGAEPGGDRPEPRDDGRPIDSRGTPAPEADSDARAAGRPATDPGRMTRAEAEALLRALGADERRLLRARRQQADQRRFENDW
jgi:hypothetical protein